MCLTYCFNELFLEEINISEEDRRGYLEDFNSYWFKYLNMMKMSFRGHEFKPFNRGTFIKDTYMQVIFAISVEVGPLDVSQGRAAGAGKSST